MRNLVLILLALAVAPHAAQAHAVAGTGTGFSSGFMHPFFGLDHVAAMVAVGIWGAVLGRPMIYVLPLAFPTMMAAGAAIGVAGLPLPGVELGIAMSAVILGVALIFLMRPGVWVAAAIVGFFALFHGYAHGVELPPALNPISYACGFVVATGLLHLVGIAVGEMARTAPGNLLTARICGVVVATIGVIFLLPAAGLA